jgi:hypothetical protein
MGLSSDLTNELGRIPQQKPEPRRNIMEVTIKDGKITITLTLTPPAPSASGKTLVVASSHGIVKTTAQINGKPVQVGVNCFIGK